MKKTSLIIMSIALLATSFFSCKKVDFNEDDINLDLPKTNPVWETLTVENSDLLSNTIKSLKYQKSTETMWILSELGLQSYKDGSFTSYDAFANRNINEIQFDSENSFLFRTIDTDGDLIFNRFNTETRKVTLATKLDWNKVKHGIDFTYERSTDNPQNLIIEIENNTEELDFGKLIRNRIEEEAIQLNYKQETVDYGLDTVKYYIVKIDETDSLCYNAVPDTLSAHWYSLYEAYCSIEVVDTILEFTEMAFLSDGTSLNFSLNDNNEKPIAYKYIDYNSNTIPFLKSISSDTLNLGRKYCWIYPSGEVCNDAFNLNPKFHINNTVVDKSKTIYLNLNNKLVMYKEETFQGIQFDMKGYSFLLIDGEVYLTNKNSAHKIDTGNRVRSLYSSPVDCWVFGNEELQGFTKIDDDLWIANCEYIVRCQAGNCQNRRVEPPESSIFELRSNAIEVIDNNLIWIGYNNDGLYLVEWDKLRN